MPKHGQRFIAETAPFIEDGIRPLVVVLSRHGWLDVCYSCEGHPGKKSPIPYVTFDFVDEMSEDHKEFELDLIKEKLEGTGWGIFFKDRYACVSIDTWERSGYTIRPIQGREAKASPVEEVARRLPYDPSDPGYVYYRRTRVRDRRPAPKRPTLVPARVKP
jgi:hypothetical protein